jgi:cytochrome c oxidase subunit 2
MRWIRRAWPALALAPLLAGCGVDLPQSTLEPVGPVAQAQFDLFRWTYILSWFVLVVVIGVLVIALIRFRRRRGDDTIPKQIHGSLAVEIGWTIVPVLIVIAVAVPTVRTIFRTEARVQATANDLVVNVTGYQWWWRFEYPGYDFTTANELHIPVGTRVVLNLSSADVLHSFWVPRIAGKVDLIPNQRNQLWFEADKVGEYRGQCAELCLGAHAYMRFRVIVDTQADFEAWTKRFTDLQPQAASTDPQIEQGRQLFATKGCTTCHVMDNYRADYATGDPAFPNLTNFGLRTSLAAGVLDNTPANIQRWLEDPQSVKPGNYMPTLWSADDPKRDEETAAIAAYLYNLGKTDSTQANALVPGGSVHGDR